MLDEIKNTVTAPKLDGKTVRWYRVKLDKVLNSLERYGHHRGLKYAESVARSGHSTQERKDGNPYIVHPNAVAGIIKDFHFNHRISEELLIFSEIIAELHDLAEDEKYTHWNLKDIKKEFSAEVSYVVESLTENKEKRKKLELDMKDGLITKKELKVEMLNDSLNKIDKLKAIPNKGYYQAAAMVRIADILHNTEKFETLDLDL